MNSKSKSHVLTFFFYKLIADLKCIYQRLNELNVQCFYNKMGYSDFKKLLFPVRVQQQDAKVQPNSYLSCLTLNTTFKQSGVSHRYTTVSSLPFATHAAVTSFHYSVSLALLSLLPGPLRCSMQWDCFKFHHNIPQGIQYY